MKKSLKYIALLLACCLLLSVTAFAAEKKGLRIAVIDTGISTQAVDPDSIAQGINYIRPQDDTEDKIGHGTAVAAILVGSESARIEGICPGVTLVPIVYCSVNDEGLEVRGDTAMIAQAIYDAIDVYGCSIINLSSGTKTEVQSLQKAIAYAESKNVLVVSCAGNSQQKEPEAVYYPGAYETVLCVGAANSDGTVASFSQQNDTVDLLALGTDLRLASVKGTRIRGEGTSYSTAIVTGAAARLWTLYPELSVSELRSAILTCTHAVGLWQVLNLDAVMAFAPNEYTEQFAFTDVAKSAYYYDAVQWAYKNGITDGMTATTFGPDNTVNRAQIVTFLWRASGCPTPSKSVSFGDIDTNEYYYTALRWAVEKGITVGTSATTFSPNGTCTNAQIITMIWRAMNGNAGDNSSAVKYYDAAIAWANSNKLLDGTYTGTYDVNAGTPRCNVMEYLYRYFVR